MLDGVLEISLWLIPLALAVVFLKSPAFKGSFGEKQVSAKAMKTLSSNNSRTALARLALSALLVGCAQGSGTQHIAAHDAPQPASRAMKGMELVSWRAADGQWHFCLLPGTNRQKSRGEIMSATTQTTELAALQAMLSAQPPGQSMVWKGLPGDAEFLPPADVVTQIREHAESRGLSLAIVELARP